MDFNPRLRLDLSSGQGSLRTLRESTKDLHKRSVPPPESDFAALPPAVDYGKAIALMNGRHTRDMHDRHVSSLRKIAAANTQGFYLQDLASGVQLLKAAAQRLAEGNGEYEGPMCELLGSLSVPFQKTRSNDDLRYEADVLGLVRMACDLAVEPWAGPLLASGCLEMVLALAVPPPPPASTAEALAREAMTLGPRMESIKVLRNIIKAGGVPSIASFVGRAVRAEVQQSRPGSSSSRAGSHLGAPPEWERPTVAAMRLLRALSREAEGSAALLGSPDLPAVLSRLGLPLGHPILSVTVETVWNALETLPALAAQALCTRPTIGILMDLHQRSLSPNVSDADRELRNEVLVLATLMAKATDLAGRAALVDGGLYAAVLEAVCADAGRLVHPNEMNLEFLLLALQVSDVAVVSRSPSPLLPCPAPPLLPCLALSSLRLTPSPRPPLRRSTVPPRHVFEDGCLPDPAGGRGRSRRGGRTRGEPPRVSRR